MDGTLGNVELLQGVKRLNLHERMLHGEEGC
jgi:hypothetical protein